MRKINNGVVKCIAGHLDDGNASITADVALARSIAYEVEARGGRVYYVGGFVRDRLLGCASKDVDIEVHNITASDLEKVLSHYGEVDSLGASFGIWSIRGHNLDIAIPRREVATGGGGHKDFRIQADPYLGTRKAAMRRDLTINALYEDSLTGEVIDYFGGISDLERGIIRHVDDASFVEDPLRVLRAAQFAARYNMRIAPTTISLCSSIDLSTLSPERIEGELRKALLKSARPSTFFEALRLMNQLQPWFQEVQALIGAPRNSEFHPEGDVWSHTMMTLNAAAGMRSDAGDGFAFMLAVLCHDFGKLSTTAVIDGWAVSPGRDYAGASVARAFLDRVVGSSKTKSYVQNMVELHMIPSIYVAQGAKRKMFNRLFDQSCNPEELLMLAQIDETYRGETPFDGVSEVVLRSRLREYREIIAQPFVKGRDLLKLGVEPGPAMGEMLRYAHMLRLAGVAKDEAIEQCLGLYRRPKEESR